MLTLILAVVAVICAIGWLARYISYAVLFWYLEQKNIPFPSEKEMEEGNRWVVLRIAKNFFNRK